MNLILNTESLRPPLTGIGNYTLNLMREYSETSSIESVRCFNGVKWLDFESQLSIANSFTQIEKEKNEVLAMSDKLRKTIRSVPGAYELRSAFIDRRFSRAVNQFSSAVYHEPNFILKPCKVPAVTTVHDLSFIHYPQYHPNERVHWLQKELPKTLDRADFIITDSDVVRDELIERFQVSEERIKTIYLGADKNYRPRSSEETAGVLADFDLVHRGYVLFVGTLEPRKGVETLLDAWCALPAFLQQAFPLVLVGPPGWHNSVLLNRIKKLELMGCVRHLSYVPANILPILYSGAAVFTYPSIYEGFGLPVLESMSSGVPVICRADTSMAEFSKGSCLLCDTGVAEELNVKIRWILENQDKQREYAEAGLAIARQYSWARCAEETASIYGLVS